MNKAFIVFTPTGASLCINSVFFSYQWSSILTVSELNWPKCITRLFLMFFPLWSLLKPLCNGSSVAPASKEYCLSSCTVDISLPVPAVRGEVSGMLVRLCWVIPDSANWKCRQAAWMIKKYFMSGKCSSIGFSTSNLQLSSS